MLSNASIGCSGQIDYNRANVRLAYQKTAETIEIVPLLHRNSLAFLGMPDRSEILATRTEDDKFTILTKPSKVKSAELITWDICTGKHLLAVKADLEDVINDFSVA